MDVIRLLSDAIANQIAAGEVVQRPASAVKELLENAIDAGAKNVQLIVKEAGKIMVQVIDDGKGMSPTDARMSFERHATSKIRESADLFNIRTMGFRGEALASIAAVSQVELKTRRTEDELATIIKIEGSNIKSQAFGQAPIGTSITVNNLFFNVPARRNFLKGNPVEMKHILDEFQRMALANPEVKFTLHHNEHELYRLGSANLSKRIVEVLDKSYRDQLASCEVDTDFIKISGFIGKPQMAKKTKGDQFFFVNNRYIKNSYLHHAVVSAYAGTIPDGTVPFYTLFLEIDPKHIDINIHPTKTEIKFDDEKTVYAILRSAATKALGVYHIAPSIDFDSNINTGLFYTPKTERQTDNYTASPRPNNTEHWQTLFDGFKPLSNPDQTIIFESKVNTFHQELEINEAPILQIHKRYLLTQIKSGLLLIDQVRAHERIFYEKALKELSAITGISQQVLFPQTLELDMPLFEASLVYKDYLSKMGFELEEIGTQAYLIKGIPVDFENENESQFLKELLIELTNERAIKDPKERLCKTLAKSRASKYEKTLQTDEMRASINLLFQTNMPTLSPDGLPCLKILDLQHIASLL